MSLLGLASCAGETVVEVANNGELNIEASKTALQVGDTAHLLVDVDECAFDGVYVPNCFTPNGDEANNVWGPVFNGDYVTEDFTMLVFNRWGNLIWESHHPDARWDGTYNGKMCQDGVYIWKMEHRRLYIVGNQIKHGHVTLLR